MLVALCSCPQGSLEDYQKASQILTDKVGADTPPEILNNIGALCYKLGQYDESKVLTPPPPHTHVPYVESLDQITAALVIV